MPKGKSSEISYHNVGDKNQSRPGNGRIVLRFRKNGNAELAISRDDARALAQVCTEFEIKSDLAGNPPLYIRPIPSSTAKSRRSIPETTTTSIRVNKDDWQWFVTYCRANGTSTCREIRKFVYLKREDAQFPPSLRRSSGYLPDYLG